MLSQAKLTSNRSLMTLPGRRISVYRLPEEDWSRHVRVDHTVTYAGGADLGIKRRR
jgi:hypothetical protein